MRQPTAKQFIVLEGLPLLWWTLRRFRAALGEEVPVTLVLHESLMGTMDELEAQYGPAGVVRIVAGGEERFHSVRNGLAATWQCLHVWLQTLPTFTWTVDSTARTRRVPSR